MNFGTLVIAVALLQIVALVGMMLREARWAHWLMSFLIALVLRVGITLAFGV